MKKILIFLVAACSLLVSCEKENSIKEVDDVCTTMDDSNFMKYCYDKFDVNHDGKVSMQEAAAVKSMDCSYKYITSLKGIQYFTSITSLECTNNKLTTLDVSKNAALEKLDVLENLLTTLDVSKNTALKVLDCSNNKLTTLDVSKNAALEKLYCFYPLNTTITVYYSSGQPVNKWKDHNYSRQNVIWKLK